MRLLHTADWHLGRVFQQISLLDDQAVLLDQIFACVRRLRPDALIIAGDIFDRSNPKREAIDLFDRFLARVYRETPTAIVAIAGNHDAPERVGFGSCLHDPTRVLIRGPLDRDPTPLVLACDDGPVAISALPFADVFAARGHFAATEPIRTPADVIAHQVAEAAAARPEGARAVVVAHAFVQGGAVSESERALDMLGGIETVPAELFAGLDYVALGHLHRAQRAGAERIRYSGSILAYGFDEVDAAKTMTLVELGPQGAITAIEAIPLTPRRPLRVVAGSFDALCRENGGGDAVCDDYVKICLSDAVTVYDALNRLRALFPNILQLEYVGRALGRPGEASAAERRQRDPLSLFASFFEDVTGGTLDLDQRRLVASALAGLDAED